MEPTVYSWPQQLGNIPCPAVQRMWWKYEIIFILKRYDWSWGDHCGPKVLTVTSEQEGPGFDSRSGRFCVELARFLCACAGSLWVRRLPLPVQNMQKLGVGLIGHSKLRIGVNVCL